MRVPFNKPCLEGREVEYVADAVRNRKISGDGPFSRRCEERLKSELGAEGVFLTTSCTDALELSALLCDVGPGDEVILPSFTFVSTANAFCLRGARPVFVDIRPDTLNLDESLIESAITSRTKVIVPVHYAGVGCEMDVILEIARRRGLRVVEDAAQAVYATYRGRDLGTLGDLGCFSFHETKSLMCGEGGALLVNDPTLVSRAEILREKGTNRAAFFRGEVGKYTWVDVGSSFLPSDILAGFLFAQLESADTIIEKRRAVYERYEVAFRPLVETGVVRGPVVPGHCTINYHMYYLLLEDGRTRDELCAHMTEAGIAAVFHYIPLHDSPFARKMGIEVRLPITESVSRRLLRLPMYNSLEPDEQQYVVDCVHRFFG